ncbi:putative Nigerythrin [Candidatus Sulfotelmatomonas gaucii]|uniref:Putative Nigerythrin n=1 Tax=Candidatus Sulfuritelmatomonas gaucii TaxID=2043161 RepID=A0A2N9M330_9BACT|nr:putative Nigerythrin [Candidatus Sulfotelmatomonas gaucii]
MGSLAEGASPMSWIRSAFCKTRKFALTLFTMLALAGVANATTTMENMEAAFNGESNAHLHYLGFALRAESEGYGEVASLFRAAARAEEVHAENHAQVIKEMGGVPHAQIETLTVRSTRENLEAAIKGESYERDTMYPDFLKQARADGNVRAVRSLNYARTAETEHAKLFSAALANLDRLKGTTQTYFYVCPTCGFTVREKDFPKCPSCFTREEAFEMVS